MTTNIPSSPHHDESDLSRRLETMTQLLDLAATSVWARLETAGPHASLNSLGLGIYLVGCQARRICTAAHPADLATLQVDDPVGDAALPEPGADDERTTVQLLTTAKELSQPLSLWQGDLFSVTQLAVDLDDLIREAKHLGC